MYSPWNSTGQNTGVGSHYPSLRDLPNPGIETTCPTVQVDSLPAELLGKPKNTVVGSLYSNNYWAFLWKKEEGNGNPCQNSCLENPMDRGAWWDTVHEVANSDMTERVTHTRTKKNYRYDISSVQSLSPVQLFATP